mgnify:CR=1 FL=1
MKKILFLSLMMLCSIFVSAQSLEFADIMGDNVNIRKSPSKSAQILMHNDKGIETFFNWAAKAGGGYKPLYLPKGYVMQIMAKQTDWYKVRFYPDYGSTHLVSPRNVRYIEGWMGSNYLKMAKPVKLSMQNLNTVLEPYEHMVNDKNLPQTALIQDGTDGVTWMLYGKIDNDHLNIYGDSDDLEVIFNPDIKGAKIEKEGSYKKLYYGNDVAIDDYSIDVTKCTPQMREQIFKAISKKPYCRRYYFNLGKNFSFEGDNGKRTFEISLR